MKLTEDEAKKTYGRVAGVAVEARLTMRYAEAVHALALAYVQHGEGDPLAAELLRFLASGQPHELFAQPWRSISQTTAAQTSTSSPSETAIRVRG